MTSFSEPHFLPWRKGVSDSSSGKGSEKSFGSSMLSVQSQAWDSGGPHKCQLRMGCLGLLSSPSGSGLWTGLRGWATEVIVFESIWQLCPNLFHSHCLVLSDLCCMCFWQDRREGLVALKFGVLGEGASGSPWRAGGQAGCFMESVGILRQLYLLNAKKPSWFNVIVAAALINQNN